MVLVFRLIVVNAIPECIYPQNQVYYTYGDCSNGVNSKLVVTPHWNRSALSDVCQVTNNSMASLVSSTIDCPYIPSKSRDGQTILAITSVALIGLSMGFCIVAHFRKNKIIQASSWVWSLMFIFGSAMTVSSAYTNVGYRTANTCNGFMGLASFGITTAFASLNLKVWRVDRIYTNNKLNVLSLADARLIPYFVSFNLVNLVFFVVWIIALSKTNFVRTVLIPTQGVNYISVIACDYGSSLFLEMWLLWPCLLILGNIILACRAARIDFLSKPQLDKTGKLIVKTAERRLFQMVSEYRTLLFNDLLISLLGGIGLPTMISKTSTDTDPDNKLNVFKTIFVLILGVVPVITYYIPKVYYGIIHFDDSPTHTKYTLDDQELAKPRSGEAFINSANISPHTQKSALVIATTPQVRIVQTSVRAFQVKVRDPNVQ